jgi:hypothetical protein
MDVVLLLDIIQTVLIFAIGFGLLYHSRVIHNSR